MHECMGGWGEGQANGIASFLNRLQLLRLECVSVLSRLTATGCQKPGSGREQGLELAAVSSFPYIAQAPGGTRRRALLLRGD